ncbi:hypothetical protein DFJ73DRAFT_353592 [Zopfochytrium polystomum]|nr:hypothetical protein DFJ73DRAFT_353592 [Zopfochytrium polystomum]
MGGVVGGGVLFPRLCCASRGIGKVKEKEKQRRLNPTTHTAKEVLQRNKYHPPCTILGALLFAPLARIFSVVPSSNTVSSTVVATSSTSIRSTRSSARTRRTVPATTVAAAAGATGVTRRKARWSKLSSRGWFEFHKHHRVRQRPDQVGPRVDLRRRCVREATQQGSN